MASFTRRHYVEIARILSDVRDPHEKQRLAEEFARMFQRDNPQFDGARFSSAVFGEGGSGRKSRELGEARRAPAARPEAREADAGFAIGVYDQHLIEENARERADPKHGDHEWYGEMMQLGLMDTKREITPQGWDQLNEDISQIERNSVAWMRKSFITARDEGHDGDELIGTFWFDPTNPDHAYLVNLAAPGGERIDMVDTGFGDLGNTAFDGVSDFGASVLGGAINFFDIKPEDMEIIEQTLDAEEQRQRSKRSRR